MGEVYKARDTRFDRAVAVKVLPDHVASDPTLRERFEREARAVASLNHPHICTLHDIGTSTSAGQPIDSLAMELVDGESLARRLERGALPLDQALTIAVQIAGALDAAHRQGIVHRDLNDLCARPLGGGEPIPVANTPFQETHGQPVACHQSWPSTPNSRPAPMSIAAQ